ncbi:hypothetical protein KR067_008478, partial [Drosophila pandora]
TAPSTSPETKREQLVRVYEINEEQYERVLQLTKGKNLISEARLINGGFATVSETLSSGWHSLLRIVGLTTLSKADEAEKIDFDGQPLCVIKTREGEPMGRDEEVASERSLGRAIESEENESAIHCIVVLKKDPELELPSQSPNPSFAAYWNPPQTTEESPVVKQTQESDVKKEDAEQEDKEDSETTTSAPPKKKKGNKSIYPTEESTEDARQIPGAYSLPQYGSPYPGSYGSYPYGPSPYQGSSPYGPQPYVPPYGQSPYGPYGPYGPQPPYGAQQPYGPPPPQRPPYVNPYFPQQVYGPQPYPGVYPYLDKDGQKAEENEEDDQDEEESEEDDDYRKRYYYKKTYVQQPYYY